MSHLSHCITCINYALLFPDALATIPFSEPDYASDVTPTLYSVLHDALVVTPPLFRLQVGTLRDRLREFSWDEKPYAKKAIID